MRRLALGCSPRSVLLSWAVVSSAHPAEAAPKPSGIWHITKNEWTEADEKGFGDFVRAIGESGCRHTDSCLRRRRQSLSRQRSRNRFRFISDCADLPYMLRAYYAWKNGLPFSYVDDVTGHGADIRYTANANRIACFAARHHRQRQRFLNGPAYPRYHAQRGVLGHLPHRCGQ